MRSDSSTHEEEIINFPISSFLEQHVSNVKVSVIENVKPKSTAIGLVGFQHLAQVVFLEGLKVGCVLLKALPFPDGLGERVQALAEQHVSGGRIAVNVIVEVEALEFLKHCFRESMSTAIISSKKLLTCSLTRWNEAA
jgi:hypothetical protein